MEFGHLRCIFFMIYLCVSPVLSVEVETLVAIGLHANVVSDSEPKNISCVRLHLIDFIAKGGVYSLFIGAL